MHGRTSFIDSVLRIGVVGLNGRSPRRFTRHNFVTRMAHSTYSSYETVESFVFENAFCLEMHCRTSLFWRSPRRFTRQYFFTRMAHSTYSSYETAESFRFRKRVDFALTCLVSRVFTGDVEVDRGDTNLTFNFT